MIRLRPHHLLCALTFVGEGYTETFVANFRDVLARIDAGEPIEIVAGPDDICAPVVADDDAHCLLDRIALRDARTIASLAADSALAPLLAGGVLGENRVSALRVAFARGTVRGACEACSWHDLCTTIAGDGYDRSLLRAGVLG